MAIVSEAPLEGDSYEIVGDGGDDEREAGVRDEARTSDTHGCLTGVRNNAR